MTAERDPASAPSTCAAGHVRHADQHPATPCAWPECSALLGNTLTSPGVSEFPIGPAMRDGEDVGEVIGTFWREATPGGWKWKLLGTRERLRPPAP